MLSIESHNPLKGGLIKDNKLTVKFTKDLDRSTIIKNVILVRDNSRNISCIDSFYSGDVTGIKVDVKYDNRELVIYPGEVLCPNDKYVLLINNNIKDIQGSVLLHKLILPFRCESVDIAPVITYPMHNSIVQNVSKIDFIATGIVRVQISRNNLFTDLVINEGVNADAKSYILTNDIVASGNYFIRIGIGGTFSDITQVYVDNYVGSIESTDIDSIFTQIELHEEVASVTYTMSPNTADRIYPSYNRIMITINNKAQQSLPIDLVKIYDYLLEDKVFEEIEASSISYIKDSEHTYVIIDITGEAVEE